MHQPTKVTIMRTIFALLGMAAALVIGIGLTPALASGLYVMGGASLANFEDINTDNIGYSGEVGLTNGTFAAGVEVSNHMHLGNSTLAAAVNGHVFLGDWVIRPYVTGGVGATFEGHPLAQAGGGLLWVANDEGEAGSFGIYAGYEHRVYFAGFDDFDSTGNDGYAKVGLMLTF